MPAHTEREVMTPAQVAKKLGVAVGKVLTWINSGELVAVNIATSRSNRPRWAVQPEALNEFLKGRRAVPASPTVERKTRRPIGKFIYM
jgi:transposase